MRVIFVCLIFFWSWKIPYIKASEVGGPSLYGQLLVRGWETEEKLTSRHVNINRNNSITAPEDRVTVMIVPTTIRTTAHTYHPTWIRHLIVNLSKSRCHFIRYGSSHNHDIRLSRGSSKDNSHAILIVSGSGQMHHFKSTASKTESHWPQRALSSPVGNLIESGPVTS